MRLTNSNWTFSIPGSTASPGPATSRRGLAIVAALMVVFFSLSFSSFFSSGNAAAVGVNVAFVAIAAAGTTGLILTGNVDLSIGSMYGFLGMLVGEVALHTGSTPLAIAAGLVFGLVLGTFDGVLVRVLKISPLIVTIGLLSVYEGLGYVVSDNDVFGFKSSFVVLGEGKLLGLPNPLVVAIVVLVVTAFVLTRTVVGLRLYAVGGDATAAERSGIRVGRLVIGAYAINGMLIGLIAVLTTAQLGIASPELGVNFEFDVLTAVILGGIAFAGGAGRPLGVAIGVATIGILDAGLIFEGLSTWWQLIAKGGILIVALGADEFAGKQRARRAASNRRKRRQGTTAERGVEEPEPQLIAEGRAPVRSRLAHAAPVLEIGGVSKGYGAIQALEETSITLHEGEIIALLGDNGAGKSTLLKIISGDLRPDEGTILLDGEEVSFREPADARQAGIQTVYQDLALCPNLSVVHNLMLGDEPTRRIAGILRIRDDRVAAERATSRLNALGVRLPDITALVESLSGGQRQAIAISRVIEDGVKVVCLDEPTAALGVTQSAHVLEQIRAVAERGAGVVIVTHDVPSVMAVADRVCVLRRGRLIHDGPVSELNELQLFGMMSGVERLATVGESSASPVEPPLSGETTPAGRTG